MTSFCILQYFFWHLCVLFQSYDPETLQTFSEVEQNVRKDKQLKLYINKCLEVTWYMCIQNPPMEIDNEIRTGSRFDTTKYQYFKIEGNKIDYVVWPILLSAKKGTVVSRGYADAVGLAPSVRPSASNSRASNRKWFNIAILVKDSESNLKATKYKLIILLSPFLNFGSNKSKQ